MPSFTTTRGQKNLQFNAVVEQPLTPSSFGRISCVAVGLEPIHFDWKGPPGQEICLDRTGSEASRLVPGRYHIRAQAANEAHGELHVQIVPALPNSIGVDAYECTPASSGVSCDGSIRAIGHGLKEWKRFLWSNGVQTSEAVLKDVRSGWYTMIPLPVDEVFPTFVQHCPPAFVDVRPMW